MTQPTESQDHPAHTVASASKPSAVADAFAFAFDGPLRSRTPIVTISVKGGVEFHVHKASLTQNSAYFEKALKGPFLEGRTQSIDLDDIDAEHFGIYVNVLYQAVLVRGFKFSIADYKLVHSLRLWQLADRFLDSKMKAIADGSVNVFLEKFTVDGWKRYCERYGDLHSQEFAASSEFLGLQQCFRICEEDNLPFKEQVVTVSANCPPQVFAKHVEQLDDDFKNAVTIAFALRWVDSQDSKDVGTDQTSKGRQMQKKRKLPTTEKSRRS